MIVFFPIDIEILVHWSICSFTYSFSLWAPVWGQLISMVSRTKKPPHHNPIFTEGPFSCPSRCHLVNYSCSAMLCLTLSWSIGFPRNPLPCLAWNGSFLPTQFAKSKILVFSVSRLVLFARAVVKESTVEEIYSHIFSISMLSWVLSPVWLLRPYGL